MSEITSVIGKLHHQLVFTRRMNALAAAVAARLAPGLTLDLGCGNGMIAALIMSLRPDVNIIGVDVHLRPETAIPVSLYDGHTIPFADHTFDNVMVIDVLHHIDNYPATLRECLRVTRGTVVIKDHFYRNRLEWMLLSGLDWVGNAPHGVRLPYNYFTREDWQTRIKALNAVEVHRQESIPNMYPPGFQSIIGRNIQFLSQLRNNG